MMTQDNEVFEEWHNVTYGDYPNWAEAETTLIFMRTAYNAAHASQQAKIDALEDKLAEVSKDAKRIVENTLETAAKEIEKMATTYIEVGNKYPKSLDWREHCLIKSENCYVLC